MASPVNSVKTAFKERRQARRARVPAYRLTRCGYTAATWLMQKGADPWQPPAFRNVT